MKVLAKVVLALFLVSMIAMLQGCGCDTAKFITCTGTTCEAYSGCVSDAGCCAHEENGVKLKDAVALTCGIMNLITSTTNKCA